MLTPLHHSKVGTGDGVHTEVGMSCMWGVSPRLTTHSHGQSCASVDPHCGKWLAGGCDRKRRHLDLRTESATHTGGVQHRVMRKCADVENFERNPNQSLNRCDRKQKNYHSSLWSDLPIQYIHYYLICQYNRSIIRSQRRHNQFNMIQSDHISSIWDRSD